MKITLGASCPVPPGLPEPPYTLELSRKELDQLHSLTYYTSTIPEAVMNYEGLNREFEDNLARLLRDIGYAAGTAGLRRKKVQEAFS